jgi:hypothetical protein
MTWTNLDNTLFYLAHDVMRVVVDWYWAFFNYPKWFCSLVCSADVNLSHLGLVATFLAMHGLKLRYLGTEGRVLQRLVVYISGPSWDHTQALENNTLLDVAPL